MKRLPYTVSMLGVHVEFFQTTGFRPGRVVDQDGNKTKSRSDTVEYRLCGFAVRQIYVDRFDSSLLWSSCPDVRDDSDNTVGVPKAAQYVGGIVVHQADIEAVSHKRDSDRRTNSLSPRRSSHDRGTGSRLRAHNRTTAGVHGPFMCRTGNVNRRDRRNSRLPTHYFPRRYHNRPAPPMNEENDADTNPPTPRPP